MEDQLSLEFEHDALEADIKALSREISKSRESAEARSVGEKELLKMAIKALPPVKNPPIFSPPPKSQATKNILPAYAQNASAEMKLEIEYLLDMAFHRGIIKAESAAKKSSDFVQDAFRDVLAGKLYPEFQKRGILK